MGRRLKYTFLQRKYTDGQKVHEKMLDIANYYRNTNQNCNQIITSYQSEKPFWRVCGEKRTILHCWWDYKPVQQSLQRTVCSFLEKLKIELP